MPSRRFWSRLVVRKRPQGLFREHLVDYDTTPNIKTCGGIDGIRMRNAYLQLRYSAFQSCFGSAGRSTAPPHFPNRFDLARLFKSLILFLPWTALEPWRDIGSLELLSGTTWNQASSLFEELGLRTGFVPHRSGWIRLPYAEADSPKRPAHLPRCNSLYSTRVPLACPW